MDLETQSSLRTAEKILRPFMPQASRPEPHRLDVPVTRNELLEAVRALSDAHWGYLAAITGLDRPAARPQAKVTAITSRSPQPEAPAPADRLEALYHFCEGAAIVTLRVEVPYDDARLPSVCGAIPSATLYERELSEMFGITVEGTPVPDRLLLPDDWPAGVYPLRKSFSGLPNKDR